MTNFILEGGEHFGYFLLLPPAHSYLVEAVDYNIIFFSLCRVPSQPFFPPSMSVGVLDIETTHSHVF